MSGPAKTTERVSRNPDLPASTQGERGWERLDDPTLKLNASSAAKWGRWVIASSPEASARSSGTIPRLAAPPI
jgi:hypothetical protein